jgi:hypothetical protein
MSVHSTVTDAGKALSDAWNGRSSMWGNVAATAAGASDVAGLDVVDPEVAKKAVNGWTGADQADPNQQGNLGNKIGTVAGGLLGGTFTGLNPCGAVGGAALGSAAGGWLADKLSPDKETGPITVPVPPEQNPTQIAPEEP